jgi:hypothetical protein
MLTASTSCCTGCAPFVDDETAPASPDEFPGRLPGGRCPAARLVGLGATTAALFWRGRRLQVCEHHLRPWLPLGNNLPQPRQRAPRPASRMLEELRAATCYGILPESQCHWVARLGPHPYGSGSNRWSSSTSAVNRGERGSGCAWLVPVPHPRPSHGRYRRFAFDRNLPPASAPDAAAVDDVRERGWFVSDAGL